MAERGGVTCGVNDSDLFDDEDDTYDPESNKWKRLQDNRYKDGYKDGVIAGSALSLQNGFEKGYHHTIRQIYPAAQVKGVIMTLIDILESREMTENLQSEIRHLKGEFERDWTSFVEEFKSTNCRLAEEFPAQTSCRSNVLSDDDNAEDVFNQSDRRSTSSPNNLMEITADETSSHVRNETGSQVQNETGSQVRNETGSQVRNETGSQVRNETGSQVQNETGSQVRKETGSQVRKETGSQVRKETGSQVRNETGSKVQNETGSRVRNETNMKNSYETVCENSASFDSVTASPEMSDSTIDWPCELVSSLMAGLETNRDLNKNARNMFAKYLLSVESLHKKCYNDQKSNLKK